MPEQKYNSDELVPPSFLTEQFILDRLREVENDPQLHLIDYAIKPGSAAGDHYASVMFKITVTYGTGRKIVKGRRFLLKTVPEAEGQKKDFLDSMPMFPNEIKMYKYVLPIMDKLLESVGEKGFWPKCVYTCEEKQILIFDDLTQQNYEMVYDYLSVERIPILVDKIAKYHALSMAIMNKGLLDIPSLKLSSSFELDAIKSMMKAMTQYVKPLAAEAKTWPGYEKIAAKLEALDLKVIDRFMDLILNGNTLGYSVLNHGDFHIRNMMFKKNGDGSLAEVAFLDFQLPMWHSPAFDVYSLINSMGNNDVRERKYEVIKSYHTKFVEYLKVFGFAGEIPTLIQLHVELLRQSHYDAFQTLCLLPVFQTDLSGVELSELFNEGEQNPMVIGVKKLFREPVFVEHMKKLLYSLDNRGALD